MKKINNIIIFESREDQSLGLLRYDKAPIGKKFVFKFQNEQVRVFHTVGMKFPIDIHFFNEDRELIKSCMNCKPGIYTISSGGPAKYAVEIPLKEQDETPKEVRRHFNTKAPGAALRRGIIGGIIGTGLNLADPNLKLSKSKTSALGLGLTAVISILSAYLFRSHKKCDIYTLNRSKYYSCRISASEKVIKKIDSLQSSGFCSKTKNPQQCKTSLKDYKEKWLEQLNLDKNRLVNILKKSK